jgi:membrane-bound metal-dependent hydrolase YbcI (DUF457 family)
MMGTTHSRSGTTAWALLTAAAPLVGVHPRWPAMAAGTLACAGAALLPDLDHEQATIAVTFGPVSEAAARLVNRISGGHRHATHSLLFVAFVYLATWLGVSQGGGWFAVPALFVLFAFGIRAMRLAPGLSVFVAAAATGFFWLPLRGDYGWLPIAVGVGTLAHLLGDCLTKEGCPLFWPHRARYMLPVIQRTGNQVEQWVFGPLFAVGTIALFVFAH